MFFKAAHLPLFYLVTFCISYILSCLLFSHSKNTRRTMKIKSKANGVRHLALKLLLPE